MLHFIASIWLFFVGVPHAKKGPITTCQMPNKCAAMQIAQFQTCVWPHVCEKQS